MTRLLLVFTLLIFSSCATKLFMPELETTQTEEGVVTGGTVVYNPIGLQQLTDQRRNQAFKRMRQNCGAGRTFRIVKEETAAPNSRSHLYETHVQAVGGHQVRFIDYRCIDL
jgi:hypothetical protein